MTENWTVFGPGCSLSCFYDGSTSRAVTIRHQDGECRLTSWSDESRRVLAKLVVDSGAVAEGTDSGIAGTADPVVGGEAGAELVLGNTEIDADLRSLEATVVAVAVDEDKAVGGSTGGAGGGWLGGTALCPLLHHLDHPYPDARAGMVASRSSSARGCAI